MPKLNILVTHYKEPQAFVKRLLDSIQAQHNINFEDIEVIIMNDGSECLLDTKAFVGYSFVIHYKVALHEGVANTRQHLQDIATGEYIMFCDCDDSFYCVKALEMIFNELDGCNYLSCNFFEEIPTQDDSGKVIYSLLPHDYDQVFVHGKVIKRQFLIDNNIKWVDICPSEDNYFTKLCQTVAEEYKYIDIPLYIWKWNPNSMVRSNPEWVYKKHRVAIVSTDLLLDELYARGHQSQANLFLIKQVIQTYYTIHCKGWDEHPKDKRETERYIAAFIQKYYSIIKRIPKKNIDEIMEINDKVFLTRGFEETETLSEWIERLKTL